MSARRRSLSISLEPSIYDALERFAFHRNSLQIIAQVAIETRLESAGLLRCGVSVVGPLLPEGYMLSVEAEALERTWPSPLLQVCK